jgi:Na+/H+ antiporter 1
MTNLTVIQTSLAPEQSAARARRRPSIAARIGAMGQNRIAALLLLVATLAAIVWTNVSLASYGTFWETHLMVGVGNLHLEFTLHALVNDALMAIFFTVGLEVRREFAIGELTSASRERTSTARRQAAGDTRTHRWAPALSRTSSMIRSRSSRVVRPR